jgi:hypothetical protein
LSHGSITPDANESFVVRGMNRREIGGKEAARTAKIPQMGVVTSRNYG